MEILRGAKMVDKRTLRKGKTYEEIYGAIKANLINKKKRTALKNKTNSLKGKKYEEIYGEQKAKKKREYISKKRKGMKFTKAHKLNIGKGGKGRTPWNKGKKWEELLSKEKVIKLKADWSKKRKGKNAWNKGGTLSEDQKQHLSKINIGKGNPNFGLKRSFETIEKIRKARAKQKNTWTSSIEKKLQHFLIELNIQFIEHKYICDIKHTYQCDIFLPHKRLVIEADGDFYHNYPKGKKIDKIRNKELLVAGYKVIRLWENEIRKMKLETFKLVLQKNGVV